MIKLARLVDYAVLVMHRLALSNTRLTVDALAGETRLSAATVRKVTNQLNNSQLLLSHRGANGGYELARPAGQISLLDVVEAMEGPVRLTECCGDSPDCEHLHHCELRSKWPSVNQLITDTLARVSIADFTREHPAQANETQVSARIPVQYIGMTRKGEPRSL